MNILIIADMHLSHNPRDSYRLATLSRELPRLIKQHKIDVLLVLGDLTESKGAHEAELVNSTVELFHTLAKLCLVVIQQGNHDWLSTPDAPFFEFLRRIPNIIWIKRPTIAAKCVADWDAGPAILLPHSANPDRDWTDIDFGRYQWVFAHQTFAGATADSGMKLSGVSLSFFPKDVRIISGDIHTPQTFGPVTYVGAPFTIDFGDDYEPRALLLTPKGLQSVLIPGPQKRLVTVSSLQELAKLHQHKGDLVKVRIKLRPDQQADWSKIVTEAKQWGAEEGVTIHEVQPELARGAKISLTKAKASTDEELLRAYADLRAVDERTLKAGLRLL